MIRQWLTQRALWWLDRVSALTYESCNAYCGMRATNDIHAIADVRLCKKRRWHTDSHMYDWCHSEVMGYPIAED